MKVCSGCIAPTSAPDSVAGDSASRGSAPEQWTAACPARQRRERGDDVDGIVRDGKEDGIAAVRHILRRGGIAAENLGGEVFGRGGGTAGDGADAVAASMHRPRKGGAKSARADEADVAKKLSGGHVSRPGLQAAGLGRHTRLAFEGNASLRGAVAVMLIPAAKDWGCHNPVAT